MAPHCHSLPALTPFPALLADRISNEAAFDLGGSSASLRFLSAGKAGLVGLLDGHQQTMEKIGNVRNQQGNLRNVRS